MIEHHLEFLSLKGACTGSSVSTLVKMPHCWKSNVAAHVYEGFDLNVEFQSCWIHLRQKGNLQCCFLCVLFVLYYHVLSC